MEMTIVNLTLKNTRGIKSLSIDMDCEDVEIKGRNATGKTTIKDAYLWVLGGRQNLRPTNYEYSSTVVTLLYMVDGGEVQKLERREAPVLKRGVLTGYTNEYSVGGLNDITRTEYESHITKTLCDFKKVPLLTEMGFFASIGSTVSQRDVLLNTLGEEDGDSLQTEKKKFLKRKIKELDIKLSEIPIKIAGIPLEGEGNIKEIEEEIKSVKESIKHGYTAEQVNNMVNELEAARLEYDDIVAQEYKAKVCEHCGKAPIKEVANIAAKKEAKEKRLKAVIARGTKLSADVEIAKENILTGDEVDMLLKLQSKLEAAKAYAANIDKIKALAEDELLYAQEIADKEKELKAAIREEKKAIGKLEASVSSKLGKVKHGNTEAGVTVKLFKKALNGTYKKTCEPYVDGIPYSSLNLATKIQIDYEIIRAMSNALGCSFPVFIDNRESLTTEISTEVQTINLIVAKCDLTIKKY